MTNPPLSERSYLCPKCNNPLKVIDSRPTTFMGEKTIIRRRKCRVCPNRFTTYEISEDNLVKNMRRAELAIEFAGLILKDRK
jgi:transcriptional regulator NrdR family protein